MRVVMTFILRILVDSDLPNALRGTVERFPERKPQAFTSGDRLLSLLDRWSSLPASPGEDLPGVEISPGGADNRVHGGKK